jgi:solute carrier family 9B (sodium/hydrogen exchanger), member 1/2
LFTGAAYIPKATVQAAIGSIPLSLGFSSGNIILAAAVLAILITAPLGAFGIDTLTHRLLNKDRL